MRSVARPFLPAGLLLVGLAGVQLLQPGTRRPLERPLATFPERIGQLSVSESIELDEEQLSVLRPDDYLMRQYRGPGESRMNLFIAYFESQRSGSTIHSPRNCLPGAGWDPVEHERVPLGREVERGAVNRYVVQHESGRRAVVYYWYQGRGRIAANEYLVKWQLLRDAVVRRRTDEALVRMVFPAADTSAEKDVERLDRVRAVSEALERYLPS